jgi:dTMP kinase
MKDSLPGGLLAVIEGIDGAGKSTIVPLLANAAKAAGLECVVSREPTNGPWGRALRESARQGRLKLEEEIEYFRRDRQEHVSQVIQPALAAGKVVVLDYYFSTAAYQGARGADPAEIIRQNELFAPIPDLILLLDLDVDSALGRVHGRGDAPDEFERREALAAVRAIFLSLRSPGLVRIDASQEAGEVARQCEAAFAMAVTKKRDASR